jgi:hypothetical protein
MINLDGCEGKADEDFVSVVAGNLGKARRVAMQ